MKGRHAHGVRERPEQRAFLNLVTRKTRILGADGAEHPNDAALAARKEILAFPELIHTGGLEEIEVASWRLVQFVHLDSLGHIGHRLFVRHQAHQIQSFDLPGSRLSLSRRRYPGKVSLGVGVEDLQVLGAVGFLIVGEFLLRPRGKQPRVGGHRQHVRPGVHLGQNHPSNPKARPLHEPARCFRMKLLHLPGDVHL